MLFSNRYVGEQNKKRGIVMKDLQRISIVLCCVLVLVIPSSVRAFECPGAASEGWGNAGDLNGWNGLAGTTIVVNLANGNPGGYLRSENVGAVMIASNSPPFSGDYTAGGIRGISVEIQLISGVDVIYPLIRLRRDYSSNGWSFSFAETLTPDGLWHNYTVPVNPAWTDQQAQDAGWNAMDDPIVVSFAETMSNITELIIAVNGAASDDVVGFDNVTLTCSLFADDFETGDADAWSSLVN